MYINVTSSRLKKYIKTLQRRREWLSERVESMDNADFDKAERNALIYAIYLMERELFEKTKEDLKEEDDE